MWKAILVDDEPGVVEGLSIMIDWSVYGFSVVATAQDGAEALRLIQMEDPDLVVTDIRMPGIDGLELVRQTQRLANHRPRFLIISGYRDFEYARQALTLGVDDYLLKPIYEEELGQTLATVAEKMEAEATTTKPDDIDLATLLADSDANPDDAAALAQAPAVMIIGSIDDYPLLRVQALSAATEADARLRRFMTRILKLGPDLGMTASERGRCVTLVPAALIRKQHGSVERYREKLLSYVNVGSKGSASFVTTPSLKTLGEVRRWWKAVPRLMTLLSIDRPQAHRAAEDLLEEGAQDDANLLKPDLDVIHAVAEANANDARSLVEELRKSAVAGRAEPGLVANYVQKLSFEMHRLLTELNGNPANVDELQLLWKTEVSRLSLATQFDLLADAASASARYIGSLSQIRPSARMQQICRDLMKSFKEDVTIRDLADRHGISPAYLGQLFRKEYGESFKDYRNRLRVEEAARLLRTTDMRVYEIAQHVGYQSTDYFERRFSSFYGTTPTSYRSEATEAGSEL